MRWESTDVTCQRWQIVVPESRREEVLTHHHGDHVGGHMSSDKTLQVVKRRFFWPHLRDSVKGFCKACDRCVARKSHKRPRAPLKRYMVGMPHERVSMYLMGPITETARGNKYVLVVSDHFTVCVTGHRCRDSDRGLCGGMGVLIWTATFRALRPRAPV